MDFKQIHTEFHECNASLIQAVGSVGPHKSSAMKVSNPDCSEYKLIMKHQILQVLDNTVLCMYTNSVTFVLQF